jgi:hypothetical protein
MHASGGSGPVLPAPAAAELPPDAPALAVAVPAAPAVDTDEAPPPDAPPLAVLVCPFWELPHATRKSGNNAYRIMSLLTFQKLK